MAKARINVYLRYTDYAGMKIRRETLLLTLVVTCLVCAAFLPVEQIISQLQQWAESEPEMAVWIVGSSFLLGVILLLPVSPIVMMAGFLFGLTKGFLLIWITGLIASSLAFWIGRTAARSWVERKVKHNRTFAAIDRAVSQNGLGVVLLTRLAMVFPYGPLNYSLGLSGVSFRDYLLGTNIGIIPAFFLVVYLGTAVSDAASVLSGDVQLERGELLIGFLFLMLVLIAAAFIIRSSLRILRQELASAKRDCHPGTQESAP